MKIQFRKVRLGRDNMARLMMINSIITEYQANGYKLTLRQLYYQLVSREVIPNQQKEYAKLSTLLKEGRMGGIVDWDAIEDRLRTPECPSSWNSPMEILDSAIRSYACPRQDGQSVYMEVWVEKDALSGVLSRVTEQYHVPIVVNRGYSSVSAMYDAFNRFHRAVDREQAIKILYLGDHDPSGIDMIRDVEDRILEFFWGYFSNDQDQEEDEQFTNDYKKNWMREVGNLDFEVIPIALTRAQIQQYNPPRNPAKITDPRATEYIRLNGDSSWEVDALRPEVLDQLLHDAIQEHLDVDEYNKMLKKEKLDRNKLTKLKVHL